MAFAFDLQPTLRGNLVHLRPLRESDFEALFAVASDPLIWEQHPASDRYQEPVFRDFFRGGIESGGAFLVLDATTGAVIGSTRYCNLRPVGAVAGLGLRGPQAGASTSGVRGEAAQGPAPINEIEIGYTFLA